MKECFEADNSATNLPVCRRESLRLQYPPSFLLQCRITLAQWWQLGMSAGAKFSVCTLGESFVSKVRGEKNIKHVWHWALLPQRHSQKPSQSQILYEPSGPWSGRLSSVSVVLSGWESLTPPGRDTNPLQVSSQQMLVLIYLPRKDGKLS